MLPVYIQSYVREFHSGQLHNFLERNELALSQAPAIRVFTDLNSEQELKAQPLLLSLLKKLNVDVIYIDTDRSTNHTSYIWAVMLKHNWDTGEPSVVVLESDTHLRPNALELLAPYAGTSEDSPWIVGSTYYGTNKWISTKDVGRNDFRKNHLNGVALYNRSKQFIDVICYATDKTNMLVNKMNYDFFMYRNVYPKLLDPDTISKKFVDNEYILNISTKEDCNLVYSDYKPKAAIVHSKGLQDAEFYRSIQSSDDKSQT